MRGIDVLLLSAIILQVLLSQAATFNCSRRTAHRKVSRELKPRPVCLRDGEKVVATVAVMDSMGLTHSSVDLAILP
jgi:hypothetical protein